MVAGVAPAAVGDIAAESRPTASPPASTDATLALDSDLQDFRENHLSSDKGSWPSDEVLGVARRVREAVRERDVAALLDLAVGELNPGPRRAYANARAFHQVFDEEWRESVLRDAPFCVGWRGCALGHGKVWFAKPGLGIGIYRIYGATPEPRPLIAPEWRFGELVLGPDCFRYEWLSSDNVKAVMDRWRIREERSYFTRNVGMYLGNPIRSFEPIPGYESLWGEVFKCATSEGAFAIDEHAVLQPPLPSSCPGMTAGRAPT